MVERTDSDRAAPCLIMVVCPGCDGTGSGDGFGTAGGGGMCRDCRATGEVTPTKRERLLAEARR